MQNRKTYHSKSISLTLKPIGRSSQQRSQFLSPKVSKLINNIHTINNPSISSPHHLHHNSSTTATLNQQQIPIIEQQNESQHLKQQSNIFKSKNILFSMIQDPRKTSFAYKKFLLMEKLLFLLTFIGFFLTLIKTEIEENYDTDIHIICYLISISTFSLIFCVFIRYLANFKLKIHQKKVYVMNFNQQDSIILMFFTKSGVDLYYLLIQIILIVPHPNTFLFSQTIQIFQSFDQIYLTHQLNDIMALISLLRVYIILRSLVNITLYSSPRSARLCQQNGVEHNLLYSVKCILNQQPLRAIFVVFMIAVMCLGVGLKLSEGVLVSKNPHMQVMGFQNYSNCFWCVFITMSTIGYGDYFPKTLLGRSVIFATALTGVVLSSLLIVSLSSYLQMQASQSKSHITLIRLQQQQKLKKQATQALSVTIQLFSKMYKKKQNSGGKLKSIFSDLKRKIDLVKIRNKKVKCLVDTDNILEEMDRLFEILKDNLREIYQNQVLMKTILQKIKVFQKGTRSVKLSFANQMKRARLA